MPVKGFIYDEEYREKYYSHPKVQVHLEVFVKQAKQPKTDDVKLKMSEAKLNVPKTEEQRKKMSETQKLRHVLFRKHKALNPSMSKKELWALVKDDLP